MKVLGVYEGNREAIICDKVNVFDKMEDFFGKKPDEYRKNYDKNIKDAKMFYVDKMTDSNAQGEYSIDDNIILFSNFSALPHELIHLASSDRENMKVAFEGNFYGMEVALIEGMTELLRTIIMNDKEAKAYFFEVFCVSMLTNIDGLFKPFFTASGEDFIKLFPNKKDIYSLMYSLNYYRSTLNEDYDRKDSWLVREAIQDAINSIIDIELSYESDEDKLKIYQEKFMDLISNRCLHDFMKSIYRNYENYAYHTIKRRIKMKKGIFDR